MICNNIEQIKSNIPKNVTLVTVSKTKPVSDILKAHKCNHKHFGENKVQELLAKHDKLPKDINWHMIGHLQRNKVKYIASFIHLIHSVDNIKLLKEINKQGLKHNKQINILLQIKIAQEDTKFGMQEETLKEILNLYLQNNFENIKILGFMGMATNTNNQNQTAHEFNYLYQLFKHYQKLIPEIKHLSMGMSGDYHIAIAQGSNMIRVGSAIFGTRNN